VGNGKKGGHSSLKKYYPLLKISAFTGNMILYNPYVNDAGNADKKLSTTPIKIK
jgi:hypothetical protein